MAWFAVVLLSGFLLRITGLNWDSGLHLHPDERMLIMVADRIHFFGNLNPDFFNYGSLPVYLLAGVTQLLNTLMPIGTGDYEAMLGIGRMLSLTADLFVIVVLFKAARLLIHTRATALLAAAAYAVMVFPIQNTHFFIVDTFLNLFILITVYRSLRYLQHPGRRSLLAMAVPFAAAAATKITALIYYPVLIAAILYKFRSRKVILVRHFILIHIFIIMFHFLFMPFAYINAAQFVIDTLVQMKMNSNPYIFPYTLQYVGTLPYLYHLKNIFLWGLGPVMAFISIAGMLLAAVSIRRHPPSRSHTVSLIFFLVGYILYFAVLGRSSVKFMRYMLPLYPVFAIGAGVCLSSLYRHNRRFLAVGLLASASIWTFMFLSIYSRPHTRISATRWIFRTVPPGSRIATEHWDDIVPLTDSDRYVISQLPLYDQPDDSAKWQEINATLDGSDYLIISSNRLSTPLRKLRSCHTGKACYPLTAHYYDSLFSGQYSFKKVAEFASYPELSIGPLKITIPDQDADESFTVYDHPLVTIFKKS